MAARRALVVLIVLLAATGLGTLLIQVLAPGGWTLAKLVMMAAFAGAAPWTGLCLANGLIGFVILLACRNPVQAVFPVVEIAAEVPPVPRTAIAMTVREEDMRRVLPPLRRMLRDLDLAGYGDSFAVFVLSDTRNGPAADAEAQAVATFRAEDREPARIHYRRRATNTGFKAGNVMEFLEHHAEGFELMLTLDADSEMSAAAVLRLVRAMLADPTLAIAQHLTVGLPTPSAFPRLFQFGMRAGMRTWATGQAWWQGDEGPYWGHNAVVRIAPFRAHCRMPILPDGQHILSHDQVEAAVLRAAGWGVRVLPDESGSWEANPPALPEFLRRELRWLAGNMQYRHLLRLPGLRPLGRWQLMQAILLFAGTPLYLLFLLGAATAAATDGTSAFPTAPAVALTVGWFGALYAPKLLGYAEVALSPVKRDRYGGLARTCRRGDPGVRVHLAAGRRLGGGEDGCHAPSALRQAHRMDTAEPSRARRELGRGKPAAVAADRSRRAGVRRLRRLWMDGDIVGAASRWRSADGNPALRTDCRATFWPLAARTADRGGSRRDQRTWLAHGFRASRIYPSVARPTRS